MAEGRTPQAGRRSPGGTDRWHEAPDRAPAEAALAGLRADDAALGRARRTWMWRQSADDATLAGILVDLAEHRATVVVRTCVGGCHIGVVRRVASDHCVVAVGARRVIVGLAGVTTVEPAPADPTPGVHGTPPLGHRAPPDAGCVADVLAEMCADRPVVAVTTLDGRTTTGVLDAVGRDVIVLGAGGPGAPRYARLDSVVDVTVSAADWTGSG